MSVLITVAPRDTSWVVASANLHEDLVFSSAGEAERRARSLAAEAARLGAHAEVAFYLRNGALAARLHRNPFDRADGLLAFG
jgi:hypothetical protein